MRRFSFHSGRQLFFQSKETYDILLWYVQPYPMERFFDVCSDVIPVQTARNWIPGIFRWIFTETDIQAVNTPHIWWEGENYADFGGWRRLLMDDCVPQNNKVLDEFV